MQKGSGLRTAGTLVGVQQQPVEMVHRVFAGTAALDINHVTSRIERRSVHTALHTFHQVDIFGLLSQKDIEKISDLISQVMNL